MSSAFATFRNAWIVMEKVAVGIEKNKLEGQQFGTDVLIDMTTRRPVSSNSRGQ
jgi:hypothetical protein